MIICGRKTLISLPEAINWITEKMIVIRQPIVSVRNTDCSRYGYDSASSETSK